MCIPQLKQGGPAAPAETGSWNSNLTDNIEEIIMKIWNKPQVREQAVGMEVTAYLPADIDLI